MKPSITYEIWWECEGGFMLQSIHEEKESAEKAMNELIKRDVSPVFIDKVVRTRERTHAFVV